jgi:phosphatidylinositol-3-phosphatase
MSTMSARSPCGPSGTVAARVRRAALLVAAVLVVGISFPAERDHVTAAGRAALHVARVPLHAVRAVPRFSHAILVVFENHSARRILGRVGSPFRWLAHRNALLSRYDAVAHPSLPNYLALVSGSTYGVHHDCTHCVFRGPSLADTLTAHSLTWKMYVEHLPLYLSQGLSITGPEKARLPFLYFRTLLGASGRLTVPLSAFYRDLGRHRLPSFSLVIPDLCHDMHSCSIAKGDRWMRAFLHLVLRPGLPPRTAIFVTFDEGRWTDVRGGGGRVVGIVGGPLVRPHSLSRASLDHYSLLRTIEDGFGLPALGHSADARPITGIWRRP